MKKVLLKILLINLILIPFKVNASTLNINLSCPPTAYPSETISCKITYTNELTLNALIIKYSLDEYFSYQDLNLNTTWNSYYQDKTGFVIGSTTIENNDVATLKLKISNKIKTNQDYQIELQDIDASDQNFNSITIPNVSTTIKVISKESKDENNNSNKDDQSKKNNEENNDNTNNKDDKKNLDTQNDDSTEEAIILSNDSKLKSIKLSYGNINLKKDIFEYKLIIPNNINNISIEAEPNSFKAKVTINKPTELEVGLNKITITVEAEDKTSSTYIILITREDLEEEPYTDLTKSSNLFQNINCLTYTVALIFIILALFIIKKIRKK